MSTFKAINPVFRGRLLAVGFEVTSNPYQLSFPGSNKAGKSLMHKVWEESRLMSHPIWKGELQGFVWVLIGFKNVEGKEIPFPGEKYALAYERLQEWRKQDSRDEEEYQQALDDKEEFESKPFLASVDDCFPS